MSYEGIAAEIMTQQIVRERMAGLDHLVDAPATDRRPSRARRWTAAVAARVAVPRRSAAPEAAPRPAQA